MLGWSLIGDPRPVTYLELVAVPNLIVRDTRSEYPPNEVFSFRHIYSLNCWASTTFGRGTKRVLDSLSYPAIPKRLWWTLRFIEPAQSQTEYHQSSRSPSIGPLYNTRPRMGRRRTASLSHPVVLCHQANIGLELQHSPVLNDFPRVRSFVERPYLHFRWLVRQKFHWCIPQIPLLQMDGSLWNLFIRLLFLYHNVGQLRVRFSGL